MQVNLTLGTKVGLGQRSKSCAEASKSYFNNFRAHSTSVLRKTNSTQIH